MDNDLTVIAEKLNYRYDDTLDDNAFALRDISFSVKRGDCLGIVGRTGSGKSTLVRLLNGLKRPSSGRLTVEGIDVFAKGTDPKKVRAKVGIVFQHPEYQLFAETVREDIAFGPRNIGLSKEETDKRIQSISNMLKISHILDRSPFELSGGEQKKVSIAGIIAMEPDVLVMDEPTAGLDPQSRRFIIDWFKGYLSDGRKTGIIVSHSMEDIADISDQVMVLKDGAVDFIGHPRDLFTDIETVRRNGLLLPDCIDIMHRVKEKGLNVSTYVESAHAAADEIAEVMSL